MEAPELGGAQVLSEHIGGNEVGGCPAEVDEGLLDALAHLEGTGGEVVHAGAQLARVFGDDDGRAAVVDQESRRRARSSDAVEKDSHAADGDGGEGEGLELGGRAAEVDEGVLLAGGSPRAAVTEDDPRARGIKHERNEAVFLRLPVEQK